MPCSAVAVKQMRSKCAHGAESLRVVPGRHQQQGRAVVYRAIRRQGNAQLIILPIVFDEQGGLRMGCPQPDKAHRKDLHAIRKPPAK